MKNLKKEYSTPVVEKAILETQDIMVLSTQNEEGEDNLGITVPW